MRHRILSLFLLCSLLVTSLFSREEARAWICDGRICSTAAVCCCLGELQQDSLCRVKLSAPGPNSYCDAGCACQLMVKASAPHLASLPSPFAFHSVVTVLPLPPFCWIGPAAAPSVLLPLEARGPPVGSIALATPSLRAPPAA